MLKDKPVKNKIKDILNLYNNIEESNKTAEDQTKLLKAYKDTYNYIQKIKSDGEFLNKLFSEPTQLIKKNATKDVDKYLFQATKTGDAKIVNVFDLAKELEVISVKMDDLLSKIDRQSDSIKL